MTHLLDTSALLAHYLAEPGAERVQELFEDEAVTIGVSILVLFELELRLFQLGIDAVAGAAALIHYRDLFDEILDVNEAVRFEAIRLRTGATARISAMDVLIAASASLNGATFVHRDPHFSAIPAEWLKQETLSSK